MRKEAEGWVKIASEEFQSAKYLLEKSLFRMVCYHSQQAVEKILKAILVEHEVEVPFTHNLLDLKNAVKEFHNKGAGKNNLLFYRPSEWLVGRAGAQF